VLTINIDREKAARYGLNIADVQNSIAIAVGGRQAGAV
jgi:cobalt-zinc-cadmium resistance protein CzcA